jgi:hypothetical protein
MALTILKSKIIVHNTKINSNTYIVFWWKFVQNFSLKICPKSFRPKWSFVESIPSRHKTGLTASCRQRSFRCSSSPHPTGGGLSCTRRAWGGGPPGVRGCCPPKTVGSPLIFSCGAEVDFMNKFWPIFTNRSYKKCPIQFHKYNILLLFTATSAKNCVHYCSTNVYL